MILSGPLQHPRPRQSRASHESREHGFAAVDALVALLILSSTLVLALGGLQQAARISRVAAESGRATSLARGLMARPDLEDAQGHSGSLHWRLEVDQATGASMGAGRVCGRRLMVRSSQDGRLYRFNDAVSCSATS